MTTFVDGALLDAARTVLVASQTAPRVMWALAAHRGLVHDATPSAPAAPTGSTGT